MATLVASDWFVTEDKIAELVRRTVEAVDPLAIIVFGSWARGDQREDSDLDVAVIVEDEPGSRNCLEGVTAGLRMPVDLLVISQQRFDHFRPWINTVQQEIDREGVRLYERGKQSPGRIAFERLCTGRTYPQLRAG